jgi:hypothetical protein
LGNQQSSGQWQEYRQDQQNKIKQTTARRIDWFFCDDGSSATDWCHRNDYCGKAGKSGNDLQYKLQQEETKQGHQRQQGRENSDSQNNSDYSLISKGITNKPPGRDTCPHEAGISSHLPRLEGLCATMMPKLIATRLFSD